MSMPFDQPSLRNIEIIPMARDGEFLVIYAKAEMVMVGEDEDDPIDGTGRVTIAVRVPCEFVRKHGEQKAREYIGKKVRSEILTFAPISYQMFAHKVMDQVLQHNMESMAGEPFLFGLNCGRKRN